MHFYTHNIGEFAALTRMMTLDEIGLTMVLIDEYVRTEKPITSETVAMYTDSLANRERVDSESLASRYEKRVLRRVFVETDEGWVCPVIEEQLKKYAARAEVNRANARKPRKKQEIIEAQSPEAEPQRIVSESLATKNQEPITNNQKKEGERKPASRAARAARSPFEAGASIPADYAEIAERAGVEDPQRVFSAFIDHALATGRRLVDWKAGFRVWCSRELAFHPTEAARQEARQRQQQATVERALARFEEEQRQAALDDGKEF